MDNNIAIATPKLTLEADGNIAWIILNDGRSNILGTQTLTELETVISAAAKADAVVLAGRSKVFSIGLDLHELASLDKTELIEFMDRLHCVRRALFGLPRPMITATAGSALGAGAAMVCCGDVRIGAHDLGRVGFTEAQLGLPLPASARVIATSTLVTPAKHYALVLGSMFEKEEALSLGFFQKLVHPNELLSTVKAFAEQAAKVSVGGGMIKLSLRQAALDEMDRERAISHEIFAKAWATPDAQARIAKVMRTSKITT